MYVEVPGLGAAESVGVAGDVGDELVVGDGVVVGDELAVGEAVGVIVAGAGELGGTYAGMVAAVGVVLGVPDAGAEVLLYAEVAGAGAAGEIVWTGVFRPD